MRPLKLAFVLPRFGEKLGGGAEALAAALAQAVKGDGHAVEVWCTCASDHRTWENKFPPGTTIEQGLVVRRFPVGSRNLERYIPLQMRVAEGLLLSVEEQLDWFSESVNSTALYGHIREQGPKFDWMFFVPYLFGVTFFGSLIYPEKSILIPCLHDESYAHLEVIASMFRSVRGCLFNAEAEHKLAERLYGRIAGNVVGMGFSDPPEEQNESKAPPKPYFSEKFPYLLYLGRKEMGKNLPLLIDYFISAKDRRILPPELRLIVAGSGSFDDAHRPLAKNRADICDLNFVSEEEKESLLFHSLALCQPSVNESFSIVLMEAWRACAPVLVHAFGAVTREHVIAGNGGLYFADCDEFAFVVKVLLEEPGLRERLAKNGQLYVKNTYNWQAVLDRFYAALREIEANSASLAVEVN